MASLKQQDTPDPTEPVTEEASPPPSAEEEYPLDGPTGDEERAADDALAPSTAVPCSVAQKEREARQLRLREYDSDTLAWVLVDSEDREERLRRAVDVLASEIRRLGADPTKVLKVQP